MPSFIHMDGSRIVTAKDLGVLVWLATQQYGADKIKRCILKKGVWYAWV